MIRYRPADMLALLAPQQAGSAEWRVCGRTGRDALHVVAVSVQRVSSVAIGQATRLAGWQPGRSDDPSRPGRSRARELSTAHYGNYCKAEAGRASSGSSQAVEMAICARPWLSHAPLRVILLHCLYGAA